MLTSAKRSGARARHSRKAQPLSAAFGVFAGAFDHVGGGVSGEVRGEPERGFGEDPPDAPLDGPCPSGPGVRQERHEMLGRGERGDVRDAKHVEGESNSFLVPSPAEPDGDHRQREVELNGERKLLREETLEIRAR